MTHTRITHRELLPIEQENIAAIKAAAEELMRCIGEGRSREQALARTKVEEAVMWAVKGITA